VPNPNFPFRGAFYKDGSWRVEAGPNAVLAFAREGYTNKTTLKELFETWVIPVFKVALKYWKDG
jgi:hypothetical protein